MEPRTQTQTTVVIVVLALVILGAVGYFFSDDVALRADERSVRTLITDFGTHLKNVSLLSPEAASTIEREYAPYASSALVELWKSDPSKAPGRRTSSPWPERIDITSLTPQGAGYVVQGAIIYMTSTEVDGGGNAGITPVYLQVVREDGGWQVVAYQEVATSTPSN